MSNHQYIPITSLAHSFTFWTTKRRIFWAAPTNNRRPAGGPRDFDHSKWMDFQQLGFTVEASIIMGDTDRSRMMIDTSIIFYNHLEFAGLIAFLEGSILGICHSSRWWLSSRKRMTAEQCFIQNWREMKWNEALNTKLFSRKHCVGKFETIQWKI